MRLLNLSLDEFDRLSLMIYAFTVKKFALFSSKLFKEHHTSFA